MFFALWPGEIVQDQLAAWSRELHAVSGGRAVQARDLHLTLAFVGEVAREGVAEVERAAGEVEPRAATLLLDRPGFWKHNRIVWAGASSLPPELCALSLELRGALKRSGVAFDAREFVSHVTLLRDAREPRTIPALAPIRWDWESFVLAASSPGSGRRYEILRRWERGEAKASPR